MYMFLEYLHFCCQCSVILIKLLNHLLGLLSSSYSPCPGTSRGKGWRSRYAPWPRSSSGKGWGPWSNLDSIESTSISKQNSTNRLKFRFMIFSRTTVCTIQYAYYVCMSVKRKTDASVIGRNKETTMAPSGAVGNYDAFFKSIPKQLISPQQALASQRSAVSVRFFVVVLNRQKRILTIPPPLHQGTVIFLVSYKSNFHTRFGCGMVLQATFDFIIFQ